MIYRYPFAVILLLITMIPNANAQLLPRWELGVGVGVLNLPYYRGSNIYRNYAAPYPYITYRGERLNIDRGGIQGHLFQTDRVKLDLSLAAGIPVSSDGDSPRVDMPDLDPTVELGPSLEFNLWRLDHKRQSLWLKLPIRSAHSIGGDGIFKHRGWTFSPFLEYTAESKKRDDWKTSISVGPLFADRDYHNYFYEVRPSYVTANRNEYHATSGYSGARTTLSVRKHLTDKLQIGAFARFDTLKNSAFEESPLVSSKHYRALGIAMIWMISQSDEMVHVP
jgi:outer membrane protein